MIEHIKEFLTQPESYRKDIFEATADRLETNAKYIEKDFWSCIVLYLIFNCLPDDHPVLLFKGGTSLSKAYDLIGRFSEDIDLTVQRADLGFQGHNDPTTATDLSNSERRRIFEDLRLECSKYIHGDFTQALHGEICKISDGCRIYPDKRDRSEQTVFVHYPSLFSGSTDDYVASDIRLEGGARSALEPNSICSISPYITGGATDWILQVDGIRTFAPERTYWDKLIILHGLHCGYRDADRLPTGKDRISRHYYDAAMISNSEIRQIAFDNLELLDAVRSHNQIAFRQAWKRLEQAVPGTIRLVPQSELREVIERDYEAMQDMFLGEPPEFEWILDRLRETEAIVNSL